MPTLSDTLSFINQYFWWIVIFLGFFAFVIIPALKGKEAPHNDTPYNCDLCKKEVGIIANVHNRLVCKECEEKISLFMRNPMHIKNKEERDCIIKFLDENKRKDKE